MEKGFKPGAWAWRESGLGLLQAIMVQPKVMKPEEGKQKEYQP